ncbi:TPA: hypothetical protein TZS71_000394 [Streptococcus suis]|nr:hypothetical protein [Streptococcus suis]
MTSTYIGTEYLSVNVDNMVLPAGQTSLTFQDMNHMSFIVLSDIGGWKEIIHEQIPQATFLYQTGDESFTVILENSNLPYFVTNLSAAANHHQYPDTRRRKLDITDDTANWIFSLLIERKTKSVSMPSFQPCKMHGAMTIDYFVKLFYNYLPYQLGLVRLFAAL